MATAITVLERLKELHPGDVMTVCMSGGGELGFTIRVMKTPPPSKPPSEVKALQEEDRAKELAKALMLKGIAKLPGSPTPFVKYKSKSVPKSETESEAKSEAKNKAKPVLDTATGKTYHSKSAAGKAVAHEYGLIPHNYVWYAVMKKDPTRFKEV